MGEISELCNRKGESVSTVFQQCCLLTGKVGRDARGVFSTVMEMVVREKRRQSGILEAYSRRGVAGKIEVNKSARLDLPAF